METIRRTKIVDLLKREDFGAMVNVKGWVRTRRGSKQVNFIALNDGSTINNVQIVVDLANFDEELLKLITTGACLSVNGELVKSVGSGQAAEIQAREIEVLGTCDNTYPLQKKGHSMEFLREIAHLRPRTNTFGAVFLIILIGLAIDWFGYVCNGDFFPIDTLRIPGVLQRIGLCYGIVSLMVIYINHKYLPWICGGLLLAYSILLLTGNGYACDDTNLLAVIDRGVFGEAHLYKKSPIDPEGLAGTLSAVAHTLIGFMCGRLLLEKISVNKRIVKLITAAVIMLVIGYVLSIWMPINKRVWSTTFVLVTCGWGSLLLALLMYVIDVKNINKGWTFFLVFGMNPLFLYVLSEVVAIIFSQWEIKDAIYQTITIAVPDEYLASLIYSLLFCSVMGLTGYILHRKKIYIKI